MLQLIYSVAILLNKMLNALKVPRWSTAVTPLRRAVKCDGEASHLTVGRFVYVRYLFAFTPLLCWADKRARRPICCGAHVCACPGSSVPQLSTNNKIPRGKPTCACLLRQKLLERSLHPIHVKYPGKLIQRFVSKYMYMCTQYAYLLEGNTFAVLV